MIRRPWRRLDPGASYFHYCANNTIYGTEINDEKLRDDVLTYLGTSNFDWKVKNAKETEKKAAQVAAWTEIMEEMALRKLEQKERYSGEWRSVVKVPLSSKPSHDKFLDAKLDGTVKPEWEVAWWIEEYPPTMGLYAKTGETPEVDPAKAAWDAEWNERKRTVDNLKQAFVELSEKRKFWVGNLDSATCCDVFGSFMAGAVEYWAFLACLPHTPQDALEEFLGDWSDEERKSMPERLKIFGDAILSFACVGADMTMNSFNKK